VRHRRRKAVRRSIVVTPVTTVDSRNTNLLGHISEPAQNRDEGAELFTHLLPSEYCRKAMQVGQVSIGSMCAEVGT
jgi:hypothetical protein